MPPTPKKEGSTETPAVDTSTAEGITYIDLGDRTLEIDDRGPVQQRRVWPKSQRGFGVSASVRRELEERIETEVEAPAELAKEEAEKDPKDRLPPVYDEEAQTKRDDEARKALAGADEAREKTQEEAQKDIRAKT